MIAVATRDPKTGQPFVTYVTYRSWVVIAVDTRDPKTGQPYATIEAFRKIREKDEKGK